MTQIDGSRHWVVSIAEGGRAANPARPEGTALIRALISNPHTVRVQFTTANPSHASESGPGAFVNSDGTPGSGSSADVFINRSEATAADPLRIILGHELIHAHRFMTGTDVGFGVTTTWTSPTTGITYRNIEREELYVIGVLTPSRNRPITTENRLRREQGVANRRL